MLLNSVVLKNALTGPGSCPAPGDGLVLLGLPLQIVLLLLHVLLLLLLLGLLMAGYPAALDYLLLLVQLWSWF